MPNISDADAEVMFEYTGEGCVVPKYVTIVRFHPRVIEVEDEAFRDCNNLMEIVFNERLQKIGDDAFYCCTSLSSITLPSTVTEIGDGAFQSCRDLSEVVLNKGLRKIGGLAFYKCTSLSSITLPSTVTDIELGAFYNCSNLREVMFNDVVDNLSEVVFNEGLQKIGDEVFLYCTSLSTITIPSTVTEIGGYAFRSCNNLREVVLHGLPRKIGNSAFSNCISLERFIFPTISTRLNTLIQTGNWDEIENEVNEVRGVVELSGGELFVSTQAMGGGRNWNRIRKDLDKIFRLMSCYELNEATSIFELALWKFKLDQVDKANPIPRKKCRMDVPGPVKNIILQYLPYECLLPMLDIQL